jgi:glycerol-3-phosphate O-acyltransferase
MPQDHPAPKSRFKQWLDRYLQGSDQHFSFFLPRRLGRITTTVLKMFYSGIAVGKDQTDILEKIPENAIVVYVTKHKSKFEYLFYHTEYAKRGLPVPEIGIDYRVFVWQPVSRLLKIAVAQLHYFFKHFSIQNPFESGYFRRVLSDGHAGFFSLVEKGEFYRRFVKSKLDPVRYLVEFQKTTERPVYLVPQLMFFSKDPLRSNPTIIDIIFGPEGKPGKIRRLITLFRNPGKVFVEISEPINLLEYLAHPDNREKDIEFQSLYLRRNLLRQINRHRQSVTGPVLKSMEELKESILNTERFHEIIQSQSSSRNTPVSELRKEADGYLEEISAKYSIGFIKLASLGVGYIVDTMFDGVSINSDILKYVKTASQKGPLILIPCHKSHIDYLILSYILYHNNLPCPHIAAGKNLAFWPMGPIFRRGGAFFIRRSFRGAVLYSRVFTEYLYKLLQEGFNIEFFIEGTRSRTGKLILPKLGFLSMLLDAFKNGACEDMIFVPVYIGYDRVLEESAYVHEIEGGKKEPENIFQVLRARKFLNKRFGKIYIQFHDPLSLNQLLEEHGTPLQAMNPKEKNTFCRNLGFRVINAINKTTVVTAHGLCASAILNTPKHRFTFEHLKFIVETYLTYLNIQGAKTADTLMLNQEYAIENALDAYVQRKLIEALPKEKEDTETVTEYRVNDNQRINLEYYKNNCISFFIPAAFTAIEILKLDAFQFSAPQLHAGYKFLKHLFKNEFAYDINLTAEHHVRKTIKAFIDDAILMPHQTLPDTYNVTSAGFRKLKFFANFLKTYFESYLIVITVFMQFSKEDLEAKERMKQIENRGRRMYKRKEIERKEALSKLTYKNAIDFFVSQGVKGSEDSERATEYAEAVQQYLNRLQ